MAMLAERKMKTRWVLNPKASDWSKDQNKLGQKMLEKMGWSVGKGLGAKEQGAVEAIRISYKGDTRGLGVGKRKEQEDWLQQQQSFQSLLEDLNGATDKCVKVKSLEEKSRTSRTKIHYHKFARGKDISRYSEKDLSCIVGSGFVPIKISETESVSTTPADATGSANHDGSECLELDTEDPSGDESMNRERSSRGRELKPSAKVAATFEQGPPPKKKKTKEKPTEINFISQISKNSKLSKHLNADHQSDEHSRSGRELKQTANVSASLEQTTLLKKKKPKEKCTESTPQSESEIESGNDHKDQEVSRSGRAYKPTAKAAARLEERSPSPKRKKAKENSTRLNTGIESGSDTVVKSDRDGEHSRSGRQLKPSAKVKASSNERSPSPKKKKTKECTAQPEKDVKSKPGSSKLPVISPIVDHSHSRSGREYKSSSKVMDSIEETTSNENPVKGNKKKRERIPSESSSGRAQTRKQKNNKNYTDEESGSVLLQKSPKKKSKIVTTDGSEVDMDTGSSRKCPRERLPPSENINEEMERIKPNKSKKKAKVGETQNDGPICENVSSSKKSGKTGSEEIDNRESSKQLKKKKKNAPERESGNELPANHVGNKKIRSKYDLHLDHSDAEGSLRKRIKGKQKDAVCMDTETSEESPMLTKKNKKSKADQAALNDEPSSSSGTSRKVKSSKNEVVENGFADVEEGPESSRKKSKRKSKKNGKVTHVSDEALVQSVADELEESPTQELEERKKKKAKNLADKTPVTGENNVHDSLLGKKGKRKEKNEHSNVDEPEEAETEDVKENPKATKSKKKKEKPAAKFDRLESSESQETAVSKKQDSEDAMEELASINSQSSLIYEMIGSAPSTLQVGDQPEELKKYNVLVSDSEGDD